MEKLFVKKLDDGKEFKIIFKLMQNTIVLPFETICEYLGLSSYYWSKKLADKFKCSGGKKFLWFDESKEWITYVIPRSDEGKYWKKVILDLTEHEILRSRSDSDKKRMEYINEINDLKISLNEQKELTTKVSISRMELITQLRDSKAEKNKAESQLQKAKEEIQNLQSIISDKDKELTETKDQLELARNHNTDLQIYLSNANDTIEFLQAKNKELKKQQRKLNQALGIDLLNMAQQLLNMKEV